LSPKLNYKTKRGPKDKSCWAPSLILQSPNRHPKSASPDREKSAKLRPRSKTREREVVHFEEHKEGFCSVLFLLEEEEEGQLWMKKLW
jgi:hypothetical protein